MPVSIMGLNLDVITIVDIAITAVYFFLLFWLAKKYNARFFIVLTLVVSVLAVFANLAGLTLVAKISNFYFDYCGIAFLILYGSEIKRDIIMKSRNTKMGEVAITSFKGTPEEVKSVIENIIKACQNMSKQNTGALIIVVPTSIPIQIAQSGTILDAQISSQLVESVFFPNSALHDGALLISGNRAFAGGCLLPLSQDLKLPKELGTRHRAGIGISERTDVLSIIVSEETGIISMARFGKLLRFADARMITIALEHVYGLVKTDGGIFDE